MLTYVVVLQVMHYSGTYGIYIERRVPGTEYRKNGLLQRSVISDDNLVLMYRTLYITYVVSEVTREEKCRDKGCCSTYLIHAQSLVIEILSHPRDQL